MRDDDRIAGQRGYDEDDERRIILEFQEGEAQRQKPYTKDDETALQEEVDEKSEDEKSEDEKK
jgi:hypothetical protein